MTAAPQGYMSPSIYGPANMFAQSSRNIAKSNDFLMKFGNAVTNDRMTEPQQTGLNTPRGAALSSLNTDEASFFDFEPVTNPGSPFRDQFSTPDPQGMPWAGEMNFHPLSPPDSASFSPKDWAFGFENQAPSNILTNIDPATTRAQYGQVTPPDDENDNESLLDFQLKEQQAQMQPVQLDSPTKKRKRNSSNINEQASQPTKRSRKYASRGSNATEGSNKPEDVKRSKFLERNRVAASKCRQKKKEWTQNLETRARELQKNNNMIRMNVESLRQEVLFLKGEMLKHSSCDCTQIQKFVKSGGTANFLDAHDEGITFKREHSPIESMPGTPGSRHLGSLRDFESVSPAPEASSTSIVDDENALEALLSSSIKHDTSDEGIASKVAG